MGESWRIGIDSQSETALVRREVFRVSRNPIFLGMIITLAGLFLVLPIAVTLLMLILGFVLIQIQVRLEEEHLTHMHGEDYLQSSSLAVGWLNDEGRANISPPSHYDPVYLSGRSFRARCDTRPARLHR